MRVRAITGGLVLAAFIGAVGNPPVGAQAPAAAFYGIGALHVSGISSAVWDATRVNGTLYAVGGSTMNAGGDNPSQDTPVLWTRDPAGNASLVALPYQSFVMNNPAVHITPSAAYAITPDAHYIASQSRASSSISGTQWLRVDRLLLPSPSANLNLFSFSGISSNLTLAIADDGATVFGQRVSGPTAVPIRYQIGMSANTVDLTPTGKTSGFTIPRGTSRDGLVMVGIASDGPVQLLTLLDGSRGTNAVAFRYVHDAATSTGHTTAIPLLPDGTWNMPLAISADGSKTAVIGNTPDFPRGAVYTTDGDNHVTGMFGSPNTAWLPRAPGGMTADGSVIGVTFSGAAGFGGSQQISGIGVPAFTKHAYIHNSHGWFHLSSILASQGIDLAAMGWDPGNLAITGIRTVDGVDLVFGHGGRRSVGAFDDGTVGYIAGAVEGFVAKFPAGVLASFNPQPTPPSDTSIVGSWLLPDAVNPTGVVNYMADGTYFRITPNGFERGLYSWAGQAAGGALIHTTLFDTDGGSGFSVRNGLLGLSYSVSGDEGQFADANCSGCTPTPPLARLKGTPGSIAGSWLGGPSDAPDSVLFAFTDDDVFVAFDFPDFHDSGSGTYTWNPATHELVATIGGEQTGTNFATPSADGRSLFYVDESGESFTLRRIIDPATIPVIANTPLTASGIAGQPFSYGVQASNAAMFSATGLPNGLSINGSGAITGTPTVGGQFTVTVAATNAAGVSDIETLTLTIAIPTVVGQNVVVEPEVPQGQGPVTLSFGEVTGAGTTTVTVIDQSDVPPPPGGVSLGGVVYDVSTTATYQGLITLCFSYAGIDFGTATPRLFHYENNAWVDITTSLDEASQTICGATTSLSPFAVFASSIVRTGFYAPVNPIAGFLNTVKGGSTVPLKFTVSVNGIRQTTTAGLLVTVQPIDCDTSAPQDEVETAATTGGTSLRYDAEAGYFIQNWKVPKTPGCYMVRMTTAQDGLALTARFKVR
jgi:hypothetical protein